MTIHSNIIKAHLSSANIVTPMQRELAAATRARHIRLGLIPAQAKPAVVPARVVWTIPERPAAERPFSKTSREIIAQEIARARVKPSLFHGRSQIATVCRARQLAAYRMHRYTKMSLSKIGQLLNYCDHTTVLRAIKRVEESGFCEELEAERQARFEALPRRAEINDIIRVGYENAIPVRIIAKRAGTTPGAITGRALRMGLKHPVASSAAEHKRRLSDAHKASWAARKALGAVQA